MITLNRLAWVSCLVLAPLSMAKAQDPSTKMYSVVMKFTVGDTLKYKYGTNMTMDFKGKDGADLPIPGQEMIMSATMKQKVLKLNDDGSADVQTSVTKGTMTMMGNENPIPETPATVATISKYGATKFKEMPKSAAANGMSNMLDMSKMGNMPTGTILPDHPIKVGDSWKSEMPSPLGEGKINIESTLVAVEMLDGVESLKIKQVMTMPMKMAIGKTGTPVKNEADAMMAMSGTIKSDGISFIQVGDGRLLKNTGSMEAMITMKMGA